MRFESRGGLKRRKKKKITLFCKLKSFFFSLLFFIFLFLYTSKLISKAWGSIPITFLITQNESTYDEDINKCSRKSKWLMKGQSTLVQVGFHNVSSYQIQSQILFSPFPSKET
jgi:hypothetical protein